MYEVRIFEEVFDKVISDLTSKISNREGWRLSVAEEIEFSTLEVWEDVIHNLEENPYSYCEYSKNVFLAIELYLPYILVYTIEDKRVYVHKAVSREELLK